MLSTQVYGSHGGVQTYMRRLVEVGSSYCHERGGTFSCVSFANDTPALDWPEPGLSGVPYHSVRTKQHFVAEALRAARLCKPSFALVGHLGLIPVAYLMKRLGLLPSYGLILHGFEAWRQAGLADRIAARGADFVIATTWYTAKEFALANGVKMRRMRVLPLGLAEDSVLPMQTIPSAAPLRLLTVGRLAKVERYKGVDTVMEAIASAKTKGIEVHLAIAGDGDDVPRLRAMSQDLGIPGNIDFLGHVSEDRLQDLYRNCDLFVMPSRKEGFGIVFLEAMRHGKPCIGGNHGGTPEVIDHGHNGYLVEYGDVTSLTGYLLALDADRGRILAMGKTARDKVAANYLYPHFRKRWNALFDEVLAR